MSGPAAEVRELGGEQTVPRSWGRWRAALLVVLGALVLGVLLTGTRPATLAELQAVLASGQVTEIEIVGGLPPEAVGRAQVDIRWHDGLLPRYTTVQQVSDAPLDTDPFSTPGTHADLPVVGTDLAEELTAATPTGELGVTGQHLRTGSHGELLGWRVPTWVALAAMGWVLTVIITLVSGPEPRHATRWAWFWLMCGTGTLALVLYPLLGLPRSDEPLQQAKRRLTGGWAILIALLLPLPIL